jgi:hyperosmotically inducible protein
MATQWVRALAALLLAVALAGCSSMMGQSAERTLDDSAITTAVKSKLAAERAGTLTKVDVETENGTVHLTGTVPDTAAKQRAAQLARQVNGVVAVENDLKTPAGDAPTYGEEDMP